MDYLKMYMECLQHPVVGQHMDKCFFFWPEEPLIEIDRQQVPLKQASAPFAAMAFVKELHEMVRRNMRKNFIRKEENLTGRFKGRLLMGQHIRKNLLAGRPDRNYCQYGIISEDCRENQILLAALECCARNLSQDERTRENSHLRSMIRVCRTALQGVTLRRHIHERDFAGIRHTGTFVSYKRPHALAKMVLNNQDLDPSYSQNTQANKNETIKVVPFALCTSELFERYTELHLRKLMTEQYGAGAQIRTDNDGNIEGTIPNKKGGEADTTIKVRPDFLISSRKCSWILDSKYKRPNNENNITHHDFRQIALYAAHEGVLKEIHMLKNKDYFQPDIKLSAGLVYPDLTSTKDDSNELSKIFTDDSSGSSLFSIHAYRLKCPSVNEFDDLCSKLASKASGVDEGALAKELLEAVKAARRSA